MKILLIQLLNIAVGIALVALLIWISDINERAHLDAQNSIAREFLQWQP